MRIARQDKRAFVDSRRPWAPGRSGEGDGIEARREGLVILRIDARVGERAMTLLKEGLLPLLKGRTRLVERGLRGGDGVGRDADVCVHARECLRVEVRELHLRQLGGEQLEERLKGIENGVHVLNVQSVMPRGEQHSSRPSALALQGPRRRCDLVVRGAASPRNVEIRT